MTHASQLAPRIRASALPATRAQTISLGITERERKQILQELRVLHRALVYGEANADTQPAATAEDARVPSIIHFYGAFYADGAIHIALEYMDRGSLHDVLRASGPIDDERMLARIATQVLRGLRALEELKIVHRDVKPGNVLLNSAGDIKLADLGMCGELANSISRLRSWVGTAAYMSPERISGADYTFNSDVWALGVSLWECAIGRYPFSSDGADGGLLPEENIAGLTFWELLHHIVEGDSLDDPVPSRALFSAFLAQALRRNPAERTNASALLTHEWLRVSVSDGQHGDVVDWVRQTAISTLPTPGEEAAGLD